MNITTLPDLKHNQIDEFNDLAEALRGRLTSGPLREALTMFPRAITLAHQAAAEADRNAGAVERVMEGIVRTHKRAVREATTTVQKKSEDVAVPLYPNDDQRADALAERLETDADYQALARLAGEQREVKEDMRLTADELRRQELNLRIEREREAKIEALDHEYAVRREAVEAERAMRIACADYQLRAAREERDLHLTLVKASVGRGGGA